MDIDFSKTYANLPQVILDTRLILAACNDNVSELETLLKEKANVNAIKNKSFGETALICASARGHLGSTNALIAHNADVNIGDFFGNTALIYACELGRFYIVNALIRGKANINAVNNNGCTALMSASSAGYLDIVNALIAHNADVNAINNSGETALMWSTRKNHLDITYRLLIEMTPDEREAFAGINITNNMLVEDFKQALKDNANKLYNVVTQKLKIYPDSIFSNCPTEVIHYILGFEAFVQDLPGWFRPRADMYLDATIEFCFNNKKIKNPVIFSNKRKADSLEPLKNKRLKIENEDKSLTEIPSTFLCKKRP